MTADSACASKMTPPASTRTTARPEFHAKMTPTLPGRSAPSDRSQRMIELEADDFRFDPSYPARDAWGAKTRETT